MKWVIILFSFLLLSPLASAAEPPASLIQLAKSRLVDSGRYMNGCAPAGDGLFPGWPRGVVQKCTYTMTDGFSTKPPVASRSFTSTVYLVNADAYRLAAWIDTACRIVTTTFKAREGCYTSTIEAIRDQSGAQFPLAGQVMEDLDCTADTPSDCRIERADGKRITCSHKDYAACVATAAREGGGYLNSKANGVNEQYMFRSGVTVRIAGCPNSEQPDPAFADPYAACRDNDALNRSNEHTSMRSGRARIVSTTPKMFQTYTGRSDIRTTAFSSTDYFASPEEGSRWLDLVEDTYRRAMSSADNPLIDAWVCNRYGWPKGCL